MYSLCNCRLLDILLLPMKYMARIKRQLQKGALTFSVPALYFMDANAAVVYLATSRKTMAQKLEGGQFILKGIQIERKGWNENQAF